MKIKEGEKIPSSKVFILSQNNPKEIFIEEIIEKDKIIIFGLPGAFTPTCSTKHLPGFIKSMDEIKKKNIKKVICISINDPFVMAAWGKIHKVESKNAFIACKSQNCEISKATIFSICEICEKVVNL